MKEDIWVLILYDFFDIEQKFAEMTGYLYGTAEIQQLYMDFQAGIKHKYLKNPHVYINMKSKFVKDYSNKKSP